MSSYLITCCYSSQIDDCLATINEADKMSLQS